MGKRSNKATKKSTKGTRKLSKNNSKKKHKSNKNDSELESSNTTDQMMEVLNAEPRHTMNSAMTNMAHSFNNMALNHSGMQQQMPYTDPMQQMQQMHQMQQMQQMPYTDPMQQMQQPMSGNMQSQMMMGNNHDAMIASLANNIKSQYGNNLLSVDQYAQTLRNNVDMPITQNNNMALQQPQLNLFRNISNQSNNSILV